MSIKSGKQTRRVVNDFTPEVASGLFYPPHAPPLTGRESFLVMMWKFMRNPLEGFGPLAYGRPIVSLKSMGRVLHVISDPQAMLDVLASHNGHFVKPDFIHRLLAPATRHGLLSVEGKVWRRQRRALAPVFTPRRTADFAPMIGKVYSRFYDALCAAPETELRRAMADITFDVLASALLGGEGVDQKRLKKDTQAALRAIGTLRPDDFLPWPGWVPRALWPASYLTLARLRREADKLISSRDPNNPGDDLIGQMIAARGEAGSQALSDIEIRDNLIGFFIAGYETTALTLTWAVYLLSQASGSFKKLRAEVRAVAAKGPIEYKHLKHLPFTRAVIDETLRLYPTAPIFERQCIRSLNVLGRQIEQGDIVILNTYIMHRTERLWDDPLAFFPERFLECPELRQKGAPFMPFGAGPRVCIGAAFATMEAVMILAGLVRDFDITIPNSCYPRPVMTVTLRPEGNIPARFDPVTPPRS